MSRRTVGQVGSYVILRLVPLHCTSIPPGRCSKKSPGDYYHCPPEYFCPAFSLSFRTQSDIRACLFCLVEHVFLYILLQLPIHICPILEFVLILPALFFIQARFTTSSNWFCSLVDWLNCISLLSTIHSAKKEILIHCMMHSSCTTSIFVHILQVMHVQRKCALL